MNQIKQVLPPFAISEVVSSILIIVGCNPNKSNEICVCKKHAMLFMWFPITIVTILSNLIYNTNKLYWTHCGVIFKKTALKVYFDILYNTM